MTETETYFRRRLAELRADYARGLAFHDEAEMCEASAAIVEILSEANELGMDWRAL